MMNKKTDIFYIILLLPFAIFAQGTINVQLQSVKGITITKKENTGFKEYYEIMVDQPVDHFNSINKVFKQRIFVGFNNIEAPTVMETEGYAIGNVSKPNFIKDCNLISVEHRYFGKSLPDSLDWKYLTIKQAAYDLHHIRELFGQIFKGKWMTTGISKGGQTAVAYKMFFPKDADASIAYVTPIKNSINDKRIETYLKTVSKTECGKKVFSFQKFALRNKTELLKEFDKYVLSKGYVFSKMKNETVFEYLLLEYPFAFFQNCFDCNLIPDSTALPEKIINEIITVVPPRYYSDAFKSKWETPFYMFYHELGYYEYDIADVKQWLKNDSYSNNIFVPQNIKINFDDTYLTSLNKFINDRKTEKLIFIYGELDPYTSTQPNIEKNKNCLKMIVKNGCHKSRIADLSLEQQKQVFIKLSTWLQWKIEN